MIATSEDSMEPRWPMETAPFRRLCARTRRTRSGRAACAALAAGTALAPALNAAPQTGLDCVSDLGDPTSGTAEWDAADLNNQQRAAAGLQMIRDNPALAVAVTANAAAGDGNFLGDAFRAPHRWGGKRGSYTLTTFTDRDGVEMPAALFGPRDLGAGPYPGVLLLCHACVSNTSLGIAVWYFLPPRR
jgi:hypothetical protein